MRVIICGSRTWTDQDLIETVLRGINAICGRTGEGLTLVHGNCPTGADDISIGTADRILGSVDIEPHSADWDRHGKAAGPIRNQEMADAGADLCVAFSDQPVTRGTADMVKRAKAAGIPVWVIGHG